MLAGVNNSSMITLTALNLFHPFTVTADIVRAGPCTAVPYYNGGYSGSAIIVAEVDPV